MAIENIVDGRKGSQWGVRITSDDPKFVSRFWGKVHLTADVSKCWNWLAGRYTNGYGRIWVDNSGNLAHRVAWKLTHGQYSTLNILHTCDNKQCVNPNHLHEGTNAQNMVEASERGLMQRGVDRWNAKVTPQMVKQIRQWHATGLSYATIAKKLKLGLNTVGSICRRQTWKHVE